MPGYIRVEASLWIPVVILEHDRYADGDVVWTPQEIKWTVKRMIELLTLGLVLAPTHVLEPDVPWENIVAFFEAVEEYG